MSVSGIAKLPLRPVAFSTMGEQIPQASVRFRSDGKGKFTVTFRDSRQNFIKIGHALIALLLAWLGGLVSRRLAAAQPALENWSAGAIS